jgi:hypothetical protein
MLLADSSWVTSLESYKNDSVAFESAKNELSNYISGRVPDLLSSSFRRLSGLVNSARFVNVNSGLRFIEEGFGITVSKRERDAFNEMRNPASHGKVEGVSEKRLENFYQCLNLYYKLALAYLGYDGDVIAYSEPLALLAGFSCHRHCVTARKFNLEKEEIEERAHLLWEKGGRREGHDWDDWFRAECELSKEKTTEFWGFKTNQLQKLTTTV